MLVQSFGPRTSLLGLFNLSKLETPLFLALGIAQVQMFQNPKIANLGLGGFWSLEVPIECLDSIKKVRKLNTRSFGNARNAFRLQKVPKKDMVDAGTRQK